MAPGLSLRTTCVFGLEGDPGSLCTAYPWKQRNHWGIPRILRADLGAPESVAEESFRNHPTRRYFAGQSRVSHLGAVKADLLTGAAPPECHSHVSRSDSAWHSRHSRTYLPCAAGRAAVRGIAFQALLRGVASREFSCRVRLSGPPLTVLPFVGVFAGLSFPEKISEQCFVGPSPID